jgi:benzoyl-CoA reductase subunit C
VSTLERFKSWVENRHQYARDWKARTGGKVLGCFCTYVPEEIPYAAGVLPVRVLGSHEPQDVTEPYLFGMFCPFCRDVLAQGLKGRYEYLDGIAAAHTCMHINQSFESWSMHVPVERSFFISMPSKVQSPRSRPFLAAQLGLFKKEIEEWTGKELSDADLDRAIDVYNTNRRLMWEMYEFRKRPNPPISGLEAMYVALAEQMVDKEEHSQALRELIAELPSRSPNREAGARLMLLGSEDDDTEFVKMVESVGATIVVDDHCTGTRYFWNQVECAGDSRLESIANRYIDRTPCPNRDWPERVRFPRVLQMAKDFGVQGAIIIQQKFCDPHEADIPSLAAYLQDNGIPSLFLEFDVTVPVGQFQTRVEAFLETLGQEELF